MVLLSTHLFEPAVDFCRSDLCGYDWINREIISRYKYHYMKQFISVLRLTCDRCIERFWVKIIGSECQCWNSYIRRISIFLQYNGGSGVRVVREGVSVWRWGDTCAAHASLSSRSEIDPNSPCSLGTDWAVPTRHDGNWSTSQLYVPPPGYK
jgi:hypothetical protein